MQNLKVDLKGLRGGPIEWTKDNHFRTQQYYRVYRWDGGQDRGGEGLVRLRREVMRQPRVPHAPQRLELLRRSGTFEDAGVYEGPGPAAHRFALRCARDTQSL